MQHIAKFRSKNTPCLALAVPRCRASYRLANGGCFHNLARLANGGCFHNLARLANGGCFHNLARLANGGCFHNLARLANGGCFHNLALAVDKNLYPVWRKLFSDESPFW